MNRLLARLNGFLASPLTRSGARNAALTLAASLALADNVFAQSVGNSPWENAVQVLQTAFTGPIATGLALVAIVVGGLVFAFGEGGAKRTMAGVIFGVGMAIGAVNFMAWLFPGS
jgi:type IV secretory pathway VirB2 component (pilin)